MSAGSPTRRRPLAHALLSAASARDSLPELTGEGSPIVWCYLIPVRPEKTTKNDPNYGLTPFLLELQKFKK